MFEIKNPEVLLALFLVIPASVFVFFQFRKLSAVLTGFFDGKNKSAFQKKLRRTVILRTTFRIFSWIFAVLAFSDISWGTKNVPVQKNGSTVCLVFDISWSMTARDCPEKLSRLEASKIYAENLISRLSDSSFSAVLAKGNGFVAIPETEDISAIHTLLENLDPRMMTTPGTSLGKGIETALNSLSLNSAKLSYIWVFTDGEETDKKLQEALEETSRYGIPVTFIGFGSETETEIISGDGKTPVKTALRAEKLKEFAKTSKKSFVPAAGSSTLVNYVDSRQTGSAFSLLNQIKTSRPNGESEDIFATELVPVKRHSLFIIIALAFFMLSFVVEEFNPRKKAALASTIVLMTLFTSCNSDRKEILKGSWSWYNGKYRAATAQFLNTAVNSPADSMTEQYALFGLSCTYISLDENEAALERINQMMLGTQAVPPDLESAAYYNAGIIHQRKNDFIVAAEFFKKAILADSKNVDAKINLELCNRQLEEKLALQAETEMQKVSEDKNNSEKNMQNAVFNLIRENEDKQWKKMQSNQKEDSILDY